LTNVLLMIGGAIIAFIFARSLFAFLFSMQNYGIHKERLRQLQLAGEGKTERNSTAQLVETLTKPIVRYILPKLKPIDTAKLERDLRLAGWDNYFDPSTYRAMNLLLKVAGVVALFAIWPINPIFAIVFALLFFFLFGFLLNNGVKNVKEALFNEFPDFISIIQGYLMAGVPLTKAVEETIPYVGDTWKGLLKDFVMNCNLYSVPEAIDKLCEDVDVFEVKEFFSLVKLNLEQGINIKECFEAQTEKVSDMLMEAMLNKIGRRKMLTIAVQAPLFLCIFVVAGLPTFYSMMTFKTL
jgi:Flp pilus assembly protein TadB